MEQNELYHHGILGQKWGVRRYRNKDGSLTLAGRKKDTKAINKKLNRLDRQYAKEAGKYMIARSKVGDTEAIQNSKDAKKAMQDIKQRQQKLINEAKSKHYKDASREMLRDSRSFIKQVAEMAVPLYGAVSVSRDGARYDRIIGNDYPTTVDNVRYYQTPMSVKGTYYRFR